MKQASRLSCEARRDAIMQAVKDVFAEKGFHATTTKDLARAAGVSEALLYKHFPSKQSLYEAMREDCNKMAAFIEYHRIIALESSTSTLVLLVHFLMSHFIYNATTIDRLMARSLIEDGEFVRMITRQYSDAWERKVTECLKAAEKSGELRHARVPGHLSSWFIHHIGICMMMYLQPKPPAVDYKVSKDKLIEQAVWFTLLGAGLKEEAIQRHYNSKGLTLFRKEA